eukprot:TRINITY_DN29112_c0_g2_i1.p2 TRINITY_DN29112_c0_g2~~TRINITY_DN29112_c0_g2_i1.p2  ORF type:complete len:123 (+),score=21.12 TRINITY_DN29112_c0_g2_i1:55-423(+)
MCICFFFKQKTAYEMLRSLVGSEMCIRDSIQPAHPSKPSVRILRFPHHILLHLRMWKHQELIGIQGLHELYRHVLGLDKTINSSRTLLINHARVHTLRTDAAYLDPRLSIRNRQPLRCSHRS